MIYGVNFSDNLSNLLVTLLLQKYEKNPFDMAKVQIILPTKRACLAVKQAFFKESKKKNILLPKLSALYDLDILNSEIPPAIDTTERLLLLSRLCQEKQKSTLDQALKMAVSLCELLDLSYQYDLDLSQLNELVQLEEFAIHWQQTVQFLDILYTHWPKILKARGEIDPMDQHIRQIKYLTKQIKEKKVNGPFVVAGFNDIFPALNELIETVKENDNNLILIDNFVQKQNPEIELYREIETPQEPFVTEALTKDNWQPNVLDKSALQNVKLITAETKSEEALTIALLLRHVLETKDQTGALVTTDRTLARQVISEMKRWDVMLDDSAGTPLNHTPIGEFLLLLTELGKNPCGQSYLSLLKHPLAADGQLPSVFRQKVQETEKKLRNNNMKWQMHLKTDFTNWLHLFRNNIQFSFADILKQHIELAEQLATSSDRSAAERLWQDEAGIEAFKLITTMRNMADLFGPMEANTYHEVLKVLMEQCSVRPKYGMHPRLDILGPIEARFHHADVCIIGGLNDGVFPPLPETGPWLNRPMRTELGLPAPETKIDELAMDFAHCFCSPKVYLTRSLKVDSAQSVPSRFIERLKAVAAINQIEFPEFRAHLATLVDLPEKFDVCERPAPKPPVEVRPQKMSVTQIETWRVNPYAIYARHILKLYPLNALEGQPQNAIFGTLIHQVIRDFLEKDSKSTDKNLLMQIANNVFENSELTDSQKTLLKLKFAPVADFLIEQQKEARDTVKLPVPEKKASVTFKINQQDFCLEGTADRVDLMKDDTVRIIDYKTYHSDLFTPNKVKKGLSTQLALEALLIENNGLPQILNKSVSQLTYWFLSNKKDGSECKDMLTSEKDIAELIKYTKDGLYKLVSAFQNPSVPYEVYPSATMTNKTGKEKYDNYAHLSRKQEWAMGEEDKAE